MSATHNGRLVLKPGLIQKILAWVCLMLSKPFVCLKRFDPCCLIGNWLRYHGNRLLFEGYEDDIFIASFPKSGTTWLQMILYQLTTNGKMDFCHIDRVSPWLETGFIFPSQKLTDLPAPRLLKSHLPYFQIPKYGCRYIYIARDGRDAAVSYHHQYAQHSKNHVAFATFFQWFLRGRFQFGSWFKHVREWHDNSHNLRLLFITYEELKLEPEETIKKIAQFCGLQADRKTLARVLERSSITYMRRFEPLFANQVRNLDGSISEGKPGGFIRKGQVGGWRDYYDQAMLKAYKAEYQKNLGGLSLFEGQTKEKPLRP